MLVRVLAIARFTGRYHFHGPEMQVWHEVDWFRDDENMCATEAGRLALTEFIKQKRYYRDDLPLLVLHPLHPFTIGYEAP